jgi:DNA-binding NarL/FixJ family response regulator
MDLAMPEMNGLEATRQIKALSNPPQIILVAMYDNPEYRSASKAVHADGFIPKSEFGEQLFPLIQLLFENLLVAEGQK